jgi:DNA replication protein DnaC
VIDDWAMAPMTESERRDFWEICEDRYQVRSLILTSQLPVTRWHEQIGRPDRGRWHPRPFGPQRSPP